MAKFNFDHKSVPADLLRGHPLVRPGKMFGFTADYGGFGVWWFCPPSPALGGNACRYAAYDCILK